MEADPKYQAGKVRWEVRPLSQLHFIPLVGRSLVSKGLLPNTKGNLQHDDDLLLRCFIGSHGLVTTLLIFFYQKHFVFFWVLIPAWQKPFTIRNTWLWIFSYVKEVSNFWVHNVYREPFFIWKYDCDVFLVLTKLKKLLGENHIQINNYGLSFLWIMYKPFLET